METILQDLKAKAKHIVILTSIILVSLVGYHFWHKHTNKTDAVIVSTVLQPNEQRKAIIDPIKHQITTISRDKNGKEITHTTYLPDRPIAFVEDINGKIKIEERKMGPETRPFAGMSFGDVVRVQVGADFFYFRQFDLGLGLGFNPEILKDIRPNLDLSYNFYSHTSIFIGMDIHHEILGGFKVRF